MTTEEREYYEKQDEYGFTRCYDDIIHGDIDIYDVPFEYRTASMYFRAFDRGGYDSHKFQSFNDFKTERKMIENLLISDIMYCKKNRLEEKEGQLRAALSFMDWMHDDTKRNYEKKYRQDKPDNKPKKNKRFMFRGTDYASE